MKSQYRNSVVIPLYNQEKNIKKCIAFLQKQTIPFRELEIILINDGSSDRSREICEQIEKKYTNIICINQKNKGVSSARNCGLKTATGKYIFFLDADDCLEKHTIQNVSDFFDSVYDEVDLVTYPIETIFNGKKLAPHFRYKYLKKSGVYDLREYPYIGQTTMNIVVKNKFDKNILFDENQTFSEDQRYCCDVLKEKLKMGFCSKGKYIYYRSNNSSSGRLSGACYIFEQCMNFFEQLFDEYEEVPLAFQGLYVNDIYWKLISNILFPYHYDSEQFENARQRICLLLQKCSNRVILEHPNIDFFEKYYLLRLKGPDTMSCLVDANGFGLCNQGNIALRETSMEIVITKLQVHEDKIEIDGFIKSVFLQFYKSEVVVCAVENDGMLTRKLKVTDSAHNYYLSHEKTQRFLAFQYLCNPQNVQKVRFEVCLAGRWFPTRFYFMPLVSLSHIHNIYSCRKRNIQISVDEKNCFYFSIVRAAEKKEEIWLYYDCSGVKRDNGYLQFEHDIGMKDGVIRYYIVTDEKQIEDSVYQKYFVKFGSRKHKKLLAQCTKIITAYIEDANIFPYIAKEYEKYSKDFDFEVIYLQHGVLHAVMPWKYAREKIQADKIVVSTKEETQLFVKNGFQEADLIKTGMPRFELLDKGRKHKNKILLAPSWRQYLVGGYVKHKWQPLNEKFLNSSYFFKINEFLNSKELEYILENMDYTLDVKLHPIFSIYRELFSVNSKRITFVSENVKDEDYAVFITDFSSYSFNFEYIKVPVIHFIPDLEEFKAGMNGYRQLNYSEIFWENIVENSEELIEKLEHVLKGEEAESYATFYPMKNIRENIYQSIKK